jgi:hypothetical protein
MVFMSPSRHMPGLYLDKTTTASFQILSIHLFSVISSDTV